MDSRLRYQYSGFTLIEVVIAISLLSIMMVLLFASMRIGAESWNTSESKLDSVNKKAVVYQFFKQHLSMAKPVFELNDPNQVTDISQTKLVFQGSAEAVIFVAGLPMASAHKGLQIFKVGLDPKKSDKLTVWLTPYLLRKRQKTEQADLLEGVESIKFAYFGQSTIDSIAMWSEQWERVDQQPQLIKVSIKLKDESFWPDMIFPLKITGYLPPIDDGNIQSDDEGIVDDPL